MSRKSLILGLALLTAGAALAQGYPERAVTLVVPLSVNLLLPGSLIVPRSTPVPVITMPVAVLDTSLYRSLSLDAMIPMVPVPGLGSKVEPVVKLELVMMTLPCANVASIR